MEENQQALRGQQKKWHKDVKEEVFADDDSITLNRIRDKVANMKVAWSTAKKARDLHPTNFSALSFDQVR